jgi:opacity protein-like surface antigen
VGSTTAEEIPDTIQQQFFPHELKILTMKHFSAFLLVLFATTASAQFQMGIHYVVSVPLGTMGQNIQPVNSFGINGGVRLKADRQFFIGGEMSFGSYAHKTQQQTFISPEDGSMTMTDVDLSSNIYNYHVMAGYDFAKDAAVIPYVTVKAGVSRFNTNITVADPDDNHSCHPVDEETVFSDVAFSAGVGAGLRMDASSIFTHWDERNWWFDFSVNYLHGTPVDYVNVKYLNPDEPGPNPAKGDVNVDFIDIHTDHIHEHQVAQVYSSKIDLLDFKIGIVKTFGRCKHLKY